MKNGFDFALLEKLKLTINCNLLVYGGLSSENEILKIKKIGIEGFVVAQFFVLVIGKIVF